MTVLHILTYLSLIIFIVVLLSRVIRIASAPVHLRWELYPVPHEKGRAHYGGSRLEEVDWWTKKQHKDHLGELKVMVPEILFLKGVLDHNKDLWYGTFPFHFGLYLLMGNMALLAIAAVMGISGSPATQSSTGLPYIIYFIINILIWAGSIIGTLGAIRLFFARIIVEKLRLFSTPGHYFNIILIGAIYATLLLWMITDPLCVERLTAYYAGLFQFGALPDMPLAAHLHIYICLLFIAYLPFTHMTHFVTKYFTYHSIRWEDAANTPENKMQDKIMSYLNQPVTWAAPHIGADGTKTWLAIASSPVPSTEKKND